MNFNTNPNKNMTRTIQEILPDVIKSLNLDLSEISLLNSSSFCRRSGDSLVADVASNLLIGSWKEEARKQVVRDVPNAISLP